MIDDWVNFGLVFSETETEQFLTEIRFGSVDQLRAYQVLEKGRVSEIPSDQRCRSKICIIFLHFVAQAYNYVYVPLRWKWEKICIENKSNYGNICALMCNCIFIRSGCAYLLFIFYECVRCLVLNRAGNKLAPDGHWRCAWKSTHTNQYTRQSEENCIRRTRDGIQSECPCKWERKTVKRQLHELSRNIV